MTRHLWRILLGTLCGCPIALVAAEALNRWAMSTKMVSAQSFWGGTVLHELPFMITVVPVVVAVTALGYVGCAVVWRGRLGLPEHPRLVTWLIVADFVSPIWLVAITLGHVLAR